MRGRIPNCRFYCLWVFMLFWRLAMPTGPSFWSDNLCDTIFIRFTSPNNTIELANLNRLVNCWQSPDSRFWFVNWSRMQVIRAFLYVWQSSSWKWVLSANACSCRLAICCISISKHILHRGTLNYAFVFNCFRINGSKCFARSRDTSSGIQKKRLRIWLHF